MSNPLAEVLDTFFNGRPAPKDGPKHVRIRLTKEQIRELQLGRTLEFRVPGINIQVTPRTK